MKLKDPFLARRDEQVLLNAFMLASNGLPDITIAMVRKPIDEFRDEFIVRSCVGGKRNARHYCNYHEASIAFDNTLWSAVNGQRSESVVEGASTAEGKDCPPDRQDARLGI